MFRIIMPVYNAQNYLKQAVDSIINQSLSFQENIILHLIDDASKDNSLAICREYEKKYPKNIVVTHFEKNGGVSKVRNFALTQCKEDETVIAGFVDSDDYLDRDAIKKVKEFFDVHTDIHIACQEIHYFGAREGTHKSNWRFEEREVVDITKDIEYPQFYIGGVFFRNRALKKLKFDEQMEFWEDAMAINKLLIQEKKYGLVKGALYYYRQVEDSSSLVNKAWSTKERYTSFLQDGYMSLMKYCRRKKLRVLPYIQFLVAYHLRLFLLESNRDAVMAMIPEEEMPAFKARLGKVLRHINDNIIIKLNTALPIIEAELSLKHKKKIRVKQTYTDNDLILSYKGKELARLSERNVRIFGIMNQEGYEGMLRGRFSTPVYVMKKEDYIFAEYKGQRIQSSRYGCKKKIFVLDELMRNYKNAGFVIVIPEDWEYVHFGIHSNGIDIMLNRVIMAETNFKQD